MYRERQTQGEEVGGKKKATKKKKGGSLTQYTVCQGPWRALIYLPPSPNPQAKERDSDALRACLCKVNQPQVTKLLLIWCNAFNKYIISYQKQQKDVNLKWIQL